MAREKRLAVSLPVLMVLIPDPMSTEVMPAEETPLRSVVGTVRST